MRRVLVAMIWALAVAPASADDVYYDFRKGQRPAEFVLHQVKNDEFVKIEPAGLRITLPKDYKHPFGGIGVHTTFGIKGDFEITTTAEIVEADTPAPGAYGVGVTLRVEKADPSPDFVNLARMVRAGDKQIVLWEESIGPMNENRKIRVGQAPCADSVVKLRLKRTGTTLQFLWATAAAPDNFQQLKAIEFGADDVKRILLVGYNSRQPNNNLNAVFHDLRVTSTEPAVAAPAVDAVPGNAAPGTEPSRRLWWLAAAGIALLCLVVVVLFVARGKRATPVEGASAAAPSASAHEAVEVQCPSCQKRLKVPATAAGKKVKCPACATAFVV